MTQLTPCTFTFDDEINWQGFSEGTTWNGFDNVRVTPDVFESIKAHFLHLDDDPEAWDFEPCEDGLISLSYGMATRVVKVK